MKTNEFLYDALTIRKKNENYFYSIRNFNQEEEQENMETFIKEKTVFSILQDYCKAFSITSIRFHLKDEIIVESLNGPFLYLYSISFSSFLVTFLIQQYYLQRASYLYENPLLEEIYLCGPSDQYSTYRIYQNNKIMVFTFCFDSSLFADFSFLNGFLEAFFSIRSSYIKIKEYCNVEGKPYFYSLKKGNLKIHFDSFYKSFVFSILDRYKTNNGSIFQVLDGQMSNLRKMKKRKR